MLFPSALPATLAAEPTRPSRSSERLPLLVLSLAVALLFVLVAFLWRRPAQVPYLVAVDPFGNRLVEGFAPLEATEPRLVKAELARFLHALRTVVADRRYQAELARIAGTYVEGELHQRLRTLLADLPEDGPVGGREVRVLSILHRPDGTYLVRWEEVVYGPAAPRVVAWEAVAEVDLHRALAESVLTQNPLGLRVTAFDAVRLTYA